MGVAAELSNGLGNENVEPIERLWLMAVDVVICLVKNGGDGEGGGVA